MKPSVAPGRVARFGSYEADLRSGELRKNGIRLKLPDQSFQVLRILIDNAGEIVSREELQKELWPSDTFVNFDHGLNTAVKRVRDALGDSAENPRFIETLARRGYRFVAPIEKPATPSLVQRLTLFERARWEFRWRYLLGTGIAVAILALVATLNWARSERWIWTHGKEIKSLAVLPLENLSRDPEQEYFSDGITNALITELSKAGTLRVTSRTSSVRYKGTNKSLPQIARELNVDGVIEGSVLRLGNRVRITIQLIEARTDEHLWAESYERDLGDVLRLQSEVAQAVVRQIGMHLTPAQQERLRSAPSVDPQAYEAYLRGMVLRPEATEASIKQAQAYFEEAVRRDPSFALAYVGLGDCYLDLGAYRWLAPQDAYEHASEAIHKALQLDQGLAEAHSSLGVLNWNYSWDWQTAEKEIRYAMDLNPNYVEGHLQLVWFLAWSGRRDEALAQVQKWSRLEPAYPFTPVDESAVYYHSREYKSLIESGRKSVATNPNAWVAHYLLAVGYEGSGQPALAVPEYQRAVDLSQGDSDAIAGLAHAYAAMGKRDEAEKIVGNLQSAAKGRYVSPYMIAAIYSGLNQREKAFEFLEKAYQERSPDLAYFLKADLRVDALRSDPRFAEISRRVGLPP